MNPWPGHGVRQTMALLFDQKMESTTNSLVQLPKTAIAVSDDIAVFGDIVPCPIAENGDILENSVNYLKLSILIKTVILWLRFWIS